jgi:hypothetical protein
MEYSADFVWVDGPGDATVGVKSIKAMPRPFLNLYDQEVPFYPADGTGTSLDLASSHLLGHVKQETPVAFFNATHQPAKLAQKTSFFPGTAPDNIVRTFTFRKIGESGWLFTVIEKLIKRDFQSACYFLESFDGRNRMTIFDARDIATEQSCALFDVPLGVLLCFAQGAKPITDNHVDIVP